MNLLGERILKSKPCFFEILYLYYSVSLITFLYSFRSVRIRPFPVTLCFYTYIYVRDNTLIPKPISPFEILKCFQCNAYFSVAISRQRTILLIVFNTIFIIIYTMFPMAIFYDFSCCAFFYSRPRKMPQKNVLLPLIEKLLFI